MSARWLGLQSQSSISINYQALKSILASCVAHRVIYSGLLDPSTLLLLEKYETFFGDFDDVAYNVAYDVAHDMAYE